MPTFHLIWYPQQWRLVGNPMPSSLPVFMNRSSPCIIYVPLLILAQSSNTSTHGSIFSVISLSLSFLDFSSVNFVYSSALLAFRWATKVVVLYDFVVSPPQETDSLHVQIAYLVSSEIE